MNLKELIQEVEKCNYECDVGNLLNNVKWIELRDKVFKINEIIWSLRHGNFDNSDEAISEIDNLFTYKDFDCDYTNQDEFY
ncbi:hypothetical protein [Clostridium botulinum]|uniref:hypothetical protein n=1 Tax=Clostridium botulinum TaxID=1491 RepID=UPI001C9B445E|nr:hypothetical protein [Clostridium botulinum]MBY6838708.1 hypothetical protein [Clostridium botulinum]